MTPPRIALAEPSLGHREREYLAECIDTNMVSSVGPFVAAFEKSFAERVRAPHAVACSSGTAALHVAMLVCGARTGASVPVSTLTFIASANAIAYTGAEPLFVDSATDAWNLDTEVLYDHVVALAQRGASLPTVLQPVHILGYPADLEPLVALRDHYGIRIVEDAAEAVGAEYASGNLAGRQVGTIGDIGCYSFNGNKVITTGGGGMIVTADSDLADHARHLANQARRPEPGYVHDAIGFNYRMTNVSAAIGLAQLEQLRTFLQRKRAIARRYAEAFATNEAIEWPSQPDWACPSYWLSSVLFRDRATRDAVLVALERNNVEARPLWRPLHCQAPYARSPRLGGERAELLHARGVSLPSSVSLTPSDQERVIEIVDAVLARGACS